MNRYRTVPGLGPSASKATTTTTCQKCLKKGHYSYECKASVQSRPYISRPSRSQQLQNPKLKPALAEQKMEEPKTILSEKANASPDSLDVESDAQSDTLKETSQDFTSRKRRRSASSASSSSVATISTNASNSGIKAPRAGESKTMDRGARSRSPPRSVDKHDRRHHESDLAKDRSRPRSTRVQLKKTDDDSDSEGYPRSRSRSRSRSSAGQHDSRRNRRDRSRDGPRGRGRPDKRRRSRSADVLPNNPRRPNRGPKTTRQRSLSPYSRRLALTQAMNADG